MKHFDIALVWGCFALASGCSFIDDFGKFSAAPSGLDAGQADAGGRDGGEGDAGEADAGSCLSCEEYACGSDEVCFDDDGDGCIDACMACPRCEGGCEAGCESDSTTDPLATCLCPGSVPVGSPCELHRECMGTDECLEGLCTPFNQCGNGVDDDGDGRTDYSDDATVGDPGCGDAADPSERGAFACDDGADNDGDGLGDYRTDGTGDPGCSGPMDVTEETLPGEGEPCAADDACEAGLTCRYDTCVRLCTADAECTGIYPECHSIWEVCTPVTPRGGPAQACRDDGSCDAGLTCRTILEAFDICLRPCVASADCATGGDFTECSDPDGDTLFDCWPQTDCDFVSNTGCPSGEICRMMFSTSASEPIARCMGLGGVTPAPTGGTCTAEVPCGLQNQCFADNPFSGQCLQWCYSDGSVPCPEGLSCNPFGTVDARQFGTCE